MVFSWKVNEELIMFVYYEMQLEFLYLVVCRTRPQLSIIIFMILRYMKGAVPLVTIRDTRCPHKTTQIELKSKRKILQLQESIFHKK